MALDMIGVSLSGSFPQGMPAIDQMLDNAKRAERLGYDAIWSGDHIIHARCAANDDFPAPWSL